MLKNQEREGQAQERSSWEIANQMAFAELRRSGINPKSPEGIAWLWRVKQIGINDVHFPDPKKPG